jgi:integrase
MPLHGAEVLDIITRIGAKPIDRRDAALLALGYVAGLRRSEIVGLDFERHGEGDAVVRITARDIGIEFIRSKNGSGDGESVVVPRDNNAEAVRAVEAWIREAAIEPGTPLFRSITQSGIVSQDRLTPQTVNAVIQKRVALWLRRHGAPKDKAEAAARAYSGHSLRVGFAVTAAEAGADLRSIASVTRHRSLQMPMRYAKKADQRRTSPHNLNGVGLKSR